MILKGSPLPHLKHQSFHTHSEHHLTLRLPRLIQKHQATIFIGVPTIYRQILQKTEFVQKDLPSLRYCMSAGEHLSDEVLAQWHERFGIDIYEAVGMSEFSYYLCETKSRPSK